jgi:dipeptidyl-peptidase-4
MRIKHFSFAFILALLPISVMSQNRQMPVRAKIKKNFTIDDLIPGGSTFYQSNYAKRKYTAFWGEKCVELGLDECRLVNRTDGTAEGEQLFTLTDINTALSSAGFRMQHLYEASFPYSTDPLVLLKGKGKQALVNWQTKQTVWIQTLESSYEASDWNAKSRNLAFVKEHNLYVCDANGTEKQLTTDGTSDMVYGKSVHRDEFGIEKGLFWSDQGDKLAFYRMDQSMVSPYPQVDLNLDPEEGSRCAKVAPDRYPMAGETSHKVTVGVYDVASGKTVYLNAGDPTDRYFTNIAWSPDSKTVYLIELDRSQKHAKLDAYNAETGQFTATLFREDNSKYFEPRTPIQFLPWDSKRFIYATRRDGYNHIYLYKLDGNSATLERQLTKGQFEVFNVLGFNQKEKTVVFTSNESDPIGCALYAVDMKGKRTALGDTGGWHSAVLSDAGTTAMDSWAMPEGPIAHRQDLVDTSTGKRLTFMDSQDPWDNFNVPEIKTGTLKAADGVTDLYYRLILPTNFNPEEKYPAVVYVYGGPHAHNIDASRHWGARGWDIWMAQNGYVMFCLDNRGSEHRGLDFEQATFKHLGVEEMKDQLKGIDYLKSLPYVDGDRIGVHGWSFGGFMTTSLMTTYPDVFKVGVAGGPVIDWKYYEVMYGERYMETPQSNPEGYAASSCLNKADKLKGRLLIIYGGNDPVCVPQHTLSFIRACIDADTYPDLFTYPGDEHNMMGSDRVHLHKKITQYFEDFLK